MNPFSFVDHAIFSRDKHNRFIFSAFFSRVRLILTIVGSFCLLPFPSFYKLVAGLFICLKLAIVFNAPSMVPFFPPFVSSRFGQVDIGWYLTVSATTLLILQIIVKSIHYMLETVSLFLNRLEVGTNLHLYQILLIEIIGIAFIFDDKLHHVRMVSTPTPLHFSQKKACN